MKMSRIVVFNSMCHIKAESIFCFVRHKGRPVLPNYFVARASQYLDTASNLAPRILAKPER